MPPHEIAYVGDRVDNDAGPAADAGMKSIFIRRGPWALAQEDSSDAAKASLRLESLAELPSALASL